MPRKPYKYHYIYKITCTVNDKYYIGMHSTFNLEDGYFGSGKRLGYSIKKYGRENHVKEILEHLPDRKALRQREEELVTEELIKSDPLCLNLQPGGGGGFSIEQQRKNAIRSNIRQKELRKDPEWKKKKSVRLTESLKKSYENGTRVRQQQHWNWTGKSHSEETKKKISEKAKLRTGQKNSQWGTCWINKKGTSKKVQKTDLQSWLDKGWKKGRK